MFHFKTSLLVELRRLCDTNTMIESPGSICFSNFSSTSIVSTAAVLVFLLFVVRISMLCSTQGRHDTNEEVQIGT